VAVRSAADSRRSTADARWGRTRRACRGAETEPLKSVGPPSWC